MADAAKGEMTMFADLLSYQFAQHALISCLLASIVCGLMGVLVIEKKLTMMSGGIAHTAYGGVGLGYLLGIEPMVGAVFFSVSAALGIGAIHRKGGIHTDIITALLWSSGMALGTLFITFMEGYPPDLNSYLFGSILSVTKSDIFMMSVLTALVCIAVLVFFNDWKVYLFDSDFAGISGLKTVVFEYLLLVLIAITVVVLIRLAGIVLVIALLTAPAASASLFTQRFGRRMACAVGIGLFNCLTGLWISYELDLPSGAAIVLVSAAVYFLCYFINLLRAKSSEKASIRK